MNGAIRKFNEREYVSRTGIRLSTIRRHSEPHASQICDSRICFKGTNRMREYDSRREFHDYRREYLVSATSYLLAYFCLSWVPFQSRKFVRISVKL